MRVSPISLRVSTTRHDPWVPAAVACSGVCTYRSRGLLTALILVFGEVMKEMPATLLRPFGLNTLAVECGAHLTSHVAKAVPALAIVAAGVLPVLLAVRLSARR